MCTSRLQEHAHNLCKAAPESSLLGPRLLPSLPSRLCRSSRTYICGAGRSLSTCAPLCFSKFVRVAAVALCWRIRASPAWHVSVWWSLLSSGCAHCDSGSSQNLSSAQSLPVTLLSHPSLNTVDIMKCASGNRSRADFVGAIHIDPFPGPTPPSITFRNSSSAVSQSLAASTISKPCRIRASKHVCVFVETMERSLTGWSSLSVVWPRIFAGSRVRTGTPAPHLL